MLDTSIFICPVCWDADREQALTDNGDRTFTCPVCGQTIAFNDLSAKYDHLMQIVAEDIKALVQEQKEAINKRMAVSRLLTASYKLYQPEPQEPEY